MSAAIAVRDVHAALPPAARRRCGTRALPSRRCSGVSFEVAARGAFRHRRGVRLRQVHPDAADRGTRPADERRDPHRGHGHHRPAGTATSASCGRSCRSSSRTRWARWTHGCACVTSSPSRSSRKGTTSRDAREARVHELLEAVGLSAGGGRPVPAPVLRRPAPADLDRPRPGSAAVDPARRRAGQRARRLGACPGAQPHHRAGRRARPHARVRLARPVRRPPHLRPGGSDVRRRDRRARPDVAGLRRPAAPLHPAPAARCADACAAPCAAAAPPSSSEVAHDRSASSSPIPQACRSGRSGCPRPVECAGPLPVHRPSWSLRLPSVRRSLRDKRSRMPLGCVSGRLPFRHTSVVLR